MGDSHVGLQARLMSQALRKLAGTLNRTDTICLFTNQLREKIGVMFGSPETTPGGRALKFYSSVRLDIRRIETLKEGTEAIGNRVRVKVVKNKVAPPFKQAEFDVIYGQGISWEGTVLDVGLERKIVTKSGSYFSFGDERLGQGRQNATAFLTENPDLVQAILARIQVGRRAGPDRLGAAPAEGRRHRCSSGAGCRRGAGRGLEAGAEPHGARHRAPGDRSARRGRARRRARGGRSRSRWSRRRPIGGRRRARPRTRPRSRTCAAPPSGRACRGPCARPAASTRARRSRLGSRARASPPSSARRSRPRRACGARRRRALRGDPGAPPRRPGLGRPARAPRPRAPRGRRGARARGDLGSRARGRAGGTDRGRARSEHADDPLPRVARVLRGDPRAARCRSLRGSATMTGLHPVTPCNRVLPNRSKP